MSSLFDDLKQGLEEAVVYEGGNGKARVKTYTIMPVKRYSNKEIKEFRKGYLNKEIREIRMKNGCR